MPENLLERPALQADWDEHRIGITTSPLGQGFALIEERPRHAREPKGPDALFQCRVVELSLTFEDRFECAVLLPAGQ
jgi:hypothetical protein